MASSTSSNYNSNQSNHNHHQNHHHGHHHHLQLDFQQIHNPQNQQQQHQHQHQHQHPHHQSQLQLQLQQQEDLSFGGLMMQPPSNSSSSLVQPSAAAGPNYMKEGGGGGGGGAYDLGELDQALFLYMDGQPPTHPAHHSIHHPDHHHHQTSSSDQHHHHQQQQPDQRQDPSSGMRPPTLNIFPSQPMHVVLNPSSTTTKGSGDGRRIVSAAAAAATAGPSGSNSANKRPSTTTNNIEPSMELSTNPKNDTSSAAPLSSKSTKREGHHRRGPTSSSEQEGPKTPDPKTLRRLAQNREAARKSRLRKKAYVQQLESSRIRLSQLEQELTRARAQGIFFGGGINGAGTSGGDLHGLPAGVTNISSDAAVFDLEYARWVEEHQRMTCELRAAVQENLPDNELKMYIDSCLAHYDVVLNLKGMIAKADVFHLVSGMWKTPAERCFMWIGGFRPSELIKIIAQQIEPLTEQQLLGICQLQQSTHEAEEALSQGLESLNNSLSDTIASDVFTSSPNMAHYMGQMALAINKLSALEGFVRQADSLRQQTLHRLPQLLTIRQAARCFLGIAEYFHRLRALSSLWHARPRQDQ